MQQLPLTPIQPPVPTRTLVGDGPAPSPWFTPSSQWFAPSSQEMDLLGQSTSCASPPGPPQSERLSCCASFDEVATSPPPLRTLIDKDEVLIERPNLLDAAESGRSPCSPRPIAIPRM